MVDQKQRQCALCESKEKVNGIIRIKGVLKPVCYGCLNGVAQATPDGQVLNKVSVSKEVATAIERGLGPQYFSENKKQFLKNHKSVSKGKDSWGPTLSALNSVSFETLESALQDGYVIR